MPWSWVVFSDLAASGLGGGCYSEEWEEWTTHMYTTSRTLFWRHTIWHFWQPFWNWLYTAATGTAMVCHFHRYWATHYNYTTSDLAMYENSTRTSQDIREQCALWKESPPGPNLVHLHSKCQVLSLSQSLLVAHSQSVNIVWGLSQ